eukprot:1161653-Pelagomonas_calceolata.AAC.16
MNQADVLGYLTLSCLRMSQSFFIVRFYSLNRLSSQPYWLKAEFHSRTGLVTGNMFAPAKLPTQAYYTHYGAGKLANS